MDVREWVRRHGGVVRTADLRDAGYSRHRIGAAGLERPRRGWVAVPEADPLLRSAARAGVVLTCVTQARRLGLWSVNDDGSRAHVGAPAASGSVSAPHARVHWSTPLIARIPGSLEDPVENVLAIVAECRPFEQALAVWDSAFRQGLASGEVMRRFDLRPAARRVLADACAHLDSGLETFVFVRLRWIPAAVHPQVHLLGHRVDFLIGERLVLQIDGGHHVGAQRDADNTHDALLTLHGYTVIRVGYADVMHRWPEVQDRILRALAQGLHLS
ncbi:type IV toxin-antitoxin system AbiEi family antitoxin domain-containing protein [Microbacterium sp. LMI1x-1-1.1]|uniref:type IV toxin-antitoxin system AbiEi family antitoxin domain-containing protein n=1 Tax=Microbacterium sp. LMI1x-1-1.1 TaxID=3135246 RepID=UPI00341BA46D